jgi:membrane fusion protein, multidrug efflux system
MLLAVPGGCRRDAEMASAPAGPVVRVAAPTVRKVTDYVYFTGRTDAVESVDVQARVTGYLNTIDFKPGTEVKKGQQLFLIDPRPYQAALDEAMGQVALTEAQLKLAIADYARALEIANTPGAISQQDVDKYAAARGEAEASVAAAKATAESARLNVEFTRIVSPVDGLVSRNLLTVGNLVKQDTTLLTTVVSQDPMYSYFDVDENTLLRIGRLIQEGKIKPGRTKNSFPVDAALADEGNRYPHRGEIDFINNRVDPSTGTLQLRGVFANPPLGPGKMRQLAAGMFVRIRLPLGDPYDALLLPPAAVCTDQGDRYLLTVNAENVVERRDVVLGPQQPDGLQVVLPVKMVRTEETPRKVDPAAKVKGEIVDSITARDRIIVSGLQRAQPGKPVQAREMENNNP